MRLRGKFTLFILILFTTIIVVPIYFFNQEKQQSIDNIFEAEMEEVNFFSENIEHQLSLYTADIIVIENLPPVQGIVRAREAPDNIDPLDGTPLELWKRRLEQIFEGYSLSRSFYLQIRYLDEKGKELVRVNSTPEGPYIVPPEELQDKSARGYFREALNIPRGQTYISELDLNIEHGEIEIPFKPVIRFARVVYGAEGEARGMVIINVAADNVFGFIETLSLGDEEEDLFLIDQDGYFLVYPSKPELEFSRFGTEERSQHYLEHREHILAETLTSHRISAHDHTGEKIFVHRVIRYNPTRPERFFILVEELETRAFLAPTQNRFRQNLLFLLAIFTGAFFAFYFVSMTPLRARILRNLKVIERIKKGDFEVRINAKGSDEVEEMARGIDEMAEKLEDSQRELTGANLVLDAQLKEAVERGNILEETGEAMLNILEDARLFEKDLKEERDLVGAIISSMAEGLLLVDTGYRIMLMNPVAQRLLGVGEKKIIGKDVWSAIQIFKGDKKLSPEDLPIAKIFAEGKPVKIGLEENIFFETPSGKRFPAEVLMAPLLRRGVTAMVVIFRDITESKALDESKSSFISTASHQLRTPLGVIRWYSEMLSDEDVGHLNKNQKDFAERIHRATIRMIETIKLLLMMARMESGVEGEVKKETDVAKFTKEILAGLEVEASKKSLTMNFHAASDLPKADIDNSMLDQAITNLVSNSIHYTDIGGVINIDISVSDPATLLFKVEDNGIGIPLNAREKLFQKFFRAENAAIKIPDGSGLGLAVVKSLVLHWGGKVWFESKEKEGTTFYFTIPIARINRD